MVSAYIEAAVARTKLPISVTWEEPAGQPGAFCIMYGRGMRFRLNAESATRMYCDLAARLASEMKSQ